MNKKIKLAFTSLVISLSFTTLTYAATTPHIDSVPSSNEWSDEEAISSTKKDETNNCQITYKCKMPNNFNLASYVTIYNTDTGNLYRLIATASNDFNSRLYVPAGSYEISECGILNDSANEYPMIRPNDFIVNENDFHLIESTLINYENIEEKATKRMSDVKEDSSDFITDKASSSDETLKSLPWKTFKHSGKGPDIILSGTSSIESDIIVKITKSGSTKEGEFRYSTDNGKSWSKTSIIKATKLSTTDGSDIPIGLSIDFSSSKEYISNEVYTYHSEHEYAIESIGAIGKGQIRMTSINTPYDYNCGFAIRIEKSGKLGEAMFSYSFSYSDNANAVINYSSEQLVPANGIYQIPNTPFILTFWDGWGDFTVGDVYTATLKTPSSPRNYTPYLIGIIAFIGSAALIIILYLTSLKEKASDYVITPYEKVILKKKNNKR